MKPKRLLLFDIDGTLLSNTREAFVRPFSQAIRETLGVEVDTENYRSGGKTDPEMIHELLAPFAYSHEQIESAIPVIRDRYLEKAWPYFRGTENVVLKPGVEPLLETLSRCQEVVLGLITGNFESSARMKLEAKPVSVARQGCGRGLSIYERYFSKKEYCDYWRHAPRCKMWQAFGCADGCGGDRALFDRYPSERKSRSLIGKPRRHGSCPENIAAGD